MSAPLFKRAVRQLNKTCALVDRAESSVRPAQANAYEEPMSRFHDRIRPAFEAELHAARRAEERRRSRGRVSPSRARTRAGASVDPAAHESALAHVALGHSPRRCRRICGSSVPNRGGCHEDRLRFCCRTATRAAPTSVPSGPCGSRRICSGSSTRRGADKGLAPLHLKPQSRSGSNHDHSFSCHNPVSTRARVSRRLHDAAARSRPVAAASEPRTRSSSSPCSRRPRRRRSTRSMPGR